MKDRDHELHSPVDIGGGPDRGHALGWAGVTIGVATIALLLANPTALSGWIDEQDPTPLQLRASEVANDWTNAMDRLGVSAPRQALHRYWKKAQAARFGDEAPGTSVG
ncbi:MAG: hypothetical protein JWR77_245 [Rhizorhabdus sp.]|nr:hypothetical protein [Rhizorhabdus sp.]